MANLNDLQPRFRRVVEQLLTFIRAYDSRFVVTSGFRTRAEQQELWEKFQRGDPSQPYRALPPGKSQHERGWAVDIARFGVHPSNDETLHQLGRWWRARGGVWGGEADPVHFEAPKAWTGRG